MNDSAFSKIVKSKYIDCFAYDNIVNKQNAISIDEKTEVITAIPKNTIINDCNDSFFGELSKLLLNCSKPSFRNAKFLFPEEPRAILRQFNIFNENCFGLMVKENFFDHGQRLSSIETGIIIIVFSAKIFVFSFKGNSYDLLTILSSSAFSLDIYRCEEIKRVIVYDKTKRPTEYYTEHYNPYPKRYLKK